MSYASDEIKYTECNVCGDKKDCYIVGFDAGQAVCIDCAFIGALG